MQSFHVTGQAAVVTGAGSGIGRATAVLLAEAGLSCVYLVGKTAAKLVATAALIRTAAPQCEAVVVAADVATSAGQQAVAERVQTGGKLDLLINCAGLFTGSALADTTDAAWAAQFAVNVTAPFALIRGLAPLLRQSRTAAVVNISSTLSVKPIPQAAAYNASKAALDQLTRSLALELAPAGIRVNGVLPAVVDTPMYRARYEQDAALQDGLAFAATIHPLGRIGQPEDIARAVLFLASSAASWITGVNLPVDGGMLVT